MLPASHNGTSIFVLTAEPNQASLKTTCSRITDLQTSKTRLEARYSLGSTLRWKLTFSSLLDGDDFAAYQTAVRSLDARPVVAPFWPALQFFSEISNLKSEIPPPPVTGGLRLTWEPGWTRWELHSTPAPATFTPSAQAATAPALWGFMEKFPAPELASGEAGEISVTLIEDGPAAYALSPVATPDYGPVLHNRAWPLLNLPVNFDKTKAGGGEVEIKREKLGYTRTQAVTFFPQTPRRTIDAALRIPREDAARLIALFHACAGTVKPFWFPGQTTPTRLAADTSDTDARLVVESAAALEGQKHLWISYPDGTGAAATVILKSGNTLTLDRAPGVFAAEHATVQNLLFGRFASDDLTIDWSKGASVDSQFKLTELPPDYGSPEGETHGVTYGPLGTPACLLEISDPLTTWRITNYEAPVTIDGVTYEPREFKWDKIKQRLNLDDGTVSLTAPIWPGSPFNRLASNPVRNQQLTIVFKFADLAAPGSPVETLWSGVASSAKRKDQMLTIPVKGIGAVLEQRVPKQLDTVACWKCVYSRACGLKPADNATVATIARRTGAASYEVSLAPSRTAHYYAAGWLERVNPLGGSPTYAIIDSGATAGGLLTLTLDTDLNPSPIISETVKLYPGCDHSYAACTALNNIHNFGGHPHKPVGNPAFVGVTKSTASTSKK